jgi:ABC-type lipoprotein release transport system permease subunit
VAAYGAARLLEGMLFGVAATDATAFVVAPLVLLATALLASFLPARRATRIDPLEAIRAE